MSIKNIFVVTVTYGNRFHLLKKVIDSALSEGVAKVIVVDNNSVPESRAKLREYEKKLGSQKIKVIYLGDNYGSAGGFKRGLEEAYNDSECEFIWLLDDDNQPQKDSLKVLYEFWDNLEDENKEKKVSLLSYRKDRVAYKEAVMTNNPNLVLGRKNSFLGFHIADLPKKVLRRFKRKFGIRKFKEDKNIKFGKVSVAPYGGIFFHKNLIDSIGYPNEKFYLYADDHEWSYRITKNGGSIYLILDSLVNDIDTSWNISRNNETSVSIIATGSDFRVFYSIRNRVFFETKNLVESNIIYKLNIYFYLFLLFIANSKKYLLIKNAIRDGREGKLGKRGA
ncbi:glycosyltransferase [Thermodesulfovibrio thiophilus]|uniref:glycosyltransferase n=1 Tax=Thermodesulfovibrio thiophilus TaxID=340095 RepID=UPI0017EAD2F3|nr:glycosyltransferase [Thermodesulfovibrio thiophilus]HHW21066.1 glycosyltransferase [Thermodesulfovibrio thiophilus]